MFDFGRRDAVPLVKKVEGRRSPALPLENITDQGAMQLNGLTLKPAIEVNKKSGFMLTIRTQNSHCSEINSLAFSKVISSCYII
jgi:hypothetical protein